MMHGISETIGMGNHLEPETRKSVVGYSEVVTDGSLMVFTKLSTRLGPKIIKVSTFF